MQDLSQAIFINLPEDELNRLSRPGQFFGFPYCHAQGVPDRDFPRAARILRGLKAEGEQVPALVPMVGRAIAASMTVRATMPPMPWLSLSPMRS